MRLRATTVLPYENADRARSGLRAELHRQVVAAEVHDVRVWETFEVYGPFELIDARGRRWFRYEGLVIVHQATDQRRRRDLSA